MGLALFGSFIRIRLISALGRRPRDLWRDASVRKSESRCSHNGSILFYILAFNWIWRDSFIGGCSCLVSEPGRSISGLAVGVLH